MADRNEYVCAAMGAVLSTFLVYVVWSSALGLVDFFVSAEACPPILTIHLLNNSSALATVIPAAVLVALSQGVRRSRDGSSWNTFGHISIDNVLNMKLPHGDESILPAVLVINSPQVVLSFLYLLYNGVFTCMLVGREWSQYAVKRATLRGTYPLA